VLIKLLKYFSRKGAKNAKTAKTIEINFAVFAPLREICL